MALVAGALITIRSLYKSLSQTQKRLADYILNSVDEVPFLSSHDLARAAGVSVPTISRFVRAVGHDSFKDFRTRLGKDSRSSFEGIYQAITPGDSDRDIIQKVFRGNIKSLEGTLKIVDQGALIRAAKISAASGGESSASSKAKQPPGAIKVVSLT